MYRNRKYDFLVHFKPKRKDYYSTKSIIGHGEYIYFDNITVVTLEELLICDEAQKDINDIETIFFLYNEERKEWRELTCHKLIRLRIDEY